MQPDHHLRRALDAQPDHGLRPDPEPAQMMRQPVGVGLKRGVAQLRSSNTSAVASGVRAACAANSAGSVGKAPAPDSGRDVSFHSRRMVSRSAGRQDLQAADRPLGLRHRRRQQPHQPLAQRRNARRARTGRWNIPARLRSPPPRRPNAAAPSGSPTGRTSRSPSPPAAAAPQARPAPARPPPRCQTPASPGTADAATATAPG